MITTTRLKRLACLSLPLLALQTFTFFGVASVEAQVCTPAPAGLVSWWPLDESGDAEAIDIRDGNPGTHVNGPTPTPGIVAGGLSFDGVDDYVRIPNAANLNPGTGDFSVDFWMNTSASNSEADILSKRPICNAGSFWDLRLSGEGRIQVEMREEGGVNSNAYFGTVKVNDGQWRHIAVVREGATSLLYIDGVLDRSNTRDGPTNISNDTDILMGNGPCVGVDGTTFFDGELDEIWYSNVALSAADVEAIYNAGSAGKCKAENSTDPVIVSVTNSASGGEALSPGAEARVDGLNLSDAGDEVCFGSVIPWPTAISPCNAMVLIDGTAAAIRENFPTSIIFEIPADLPAGMETFPESVEIVVDVAGVRSAPVTVDLQRFAPAIFTNRGFGDFRRVATSEDITVENRAVPGEAIRVLATGLGPIDPAIPSGFSGLATVLAEPKVLIHGSANEVREAEVLASEGFGRGAYRVDFVLPGDLPKPLDPAYFYGVELVIDDQGERFISPQVSLPVAVGEHQISGVLDAAGFRPLISPGSIVSVFGNFVEVTARATAIPLGESLNGFSVTFNDIPGALFGVFDGAFDQSNVQVPWNLDTSSGKVEVRVHWKDEAVEVWSDPFEVDAAPASPGIYLFPPGTAQAIVTNFKQSGDDVIAGSWAQALGSIDPVVGQAAAIGGVVTLWGNGLGPVNPLPATGDIPAPGTVPFTDKTVRVFVGGVEAQVLGAVLQPTSVGLNQINIVIPAGVTPGDAVPIVIEVECEDGTKIRSREDVTIAVRSAP